MVEVTHSTLSRQTKTRGVCCVTCVLAKLRAHYPEHQHKKKEKEEGKTNEETTHTTHTAIPTHTNHHRYSTMTQPCHKDTTPNQQCCNREHKEGLGNTRGSRTMQDAGPNTKTGHRSTHHPRHSTRSPSKRKGDATHKTGRPTTQPPFTHHATHHHNGTPPSTMAPPSTTTRGERTEDTPPHEQHRHTPTTHTPQHPARDSTRHALQYSPALQWDGWGTSHTTALGRTAAHPPPFHTPKRMDTIHSSTHLLLLIHVHTTDDQR